MNKNDSELVAGILMDHGFELTEVLEQADFAMINTCSVRRHAEQRAMGRLSVLKGWKHAAPDRKIVVLGCMAQKDRHHLFDENPHIDLVVGPDAYRRLPELLQSAECRCETRENDEEIYTGIHPLRKAGISGWVTIMRGCDNYCAYCIVPYTRGRERSRPARAILEEITGMVKTGYREITLLGQNVNSYHDGNTDFPGLLEKISRIPNLPRVRFMSSHPKDCSQRLFEVMASEPALCPHLHLPFQSGSNRILHRMNRKYTREHYMDLIGQARSRIPGLAVTTDVMVGFPGESEKDFQDTVDLMQSIRFADAFMYHYSIRPGTAAEKMKPQLPQKEKLTRLNALIKIQQSISREIKLDMLGKTWEVMPEETSKQSKYEWIGKTDNNHMVVFPKENYLPGMIVPIKVKTCRGNTLRGVAA